MLFMKITVYILYRNNIWSNWRMPCTGVSRSSSIIIQNSGWCEVKKLLMSKGTTEQEVQKNGSMLRVSNVKKQYQYDFAEKLTRIVQNCSQSSRWRFELAFNSVPRHCLWWNHTCFNHFPSRWFWAMVAVRFRTNSTAVSAWPQSHLRRWFLL
jgi:hypothetical protein